MYELLAVIIYFSFILIISISSYSRNQTSTDFIIGNRSLNYWFTALAAHASDMSSWLFMAYPAMIFMFGLSKCWIAVGLLLFMYLNWQFVAPRIRVLSEKTNTLTFFSFLEKQFDDRTGTLRIFTALVCFVFYTIYISAGLVGLGLLTESLFNIPYHWAILISILIALPYVMIGGYRTLASIDLFQGIFLMLMIVFVPFFLFNKIGGLEGIATAAHSQNISLSLLPDFSTKTVLSAILVMLGWGLGYFGQPTIITKFMGIRNAHEIPKSKMVGMSWMLISLAAATFVGLVGLAFFQGNLKNSEMIFIDLVKQSFHPFLIGLILCAVFAASINVMSSQMLVLSSTFSEDIYKRIIQPNASSARLLLVSRLGIVAVSMIAFAIAYFRISSIYSLVLYAWSGLGASFGPLIIFSLYAKQPDRRSAWAGIITGSLGSASWPWINAHFDLPIDPIIVGFGLSCLVMWVFSIFQKKEKLLESRI